MSLVLIAEPELESRDRGWVEAHRAAHDPHFSIVPPHFTLIFPGNSAEAPLLAHVREATQGLGPIRFVLRSALVVKDALSPLTHVFLVPDEGFGQIVRLHDRLYTGALSKSLRLDIPYIPHIAIGAFEEPSDAKTLADDINTAPLAIIGTLRELLLAAWDGATLTPRARVALQSSR